jgi:hypothetical protein
MRTRVFLLPTIALAALATHAPAATIAVDPGMSIQAAIDAASDGDVIAVGTGEFNEEIDFTGKAIMVVGTGPDSVIHGTGNGPVVTFASGESPQSVLDSFTITGGVAERGGGIYIAGSSPTILRTLIVANRALSQGSGVYIRASEAQLYNNLVALNRSAGGDPHSIEIQDAAPRLINNTIVRGDSNGIILRGVSPAVIMNNIIAFNGSRSAAGRRGRGICDFSGGTATIHYNVFSRNVIAAVLTDGADYRRVRDVQNATGSPRFEGNLDGLPGFRRTRPTQSGTVRVEDFALRRNARAVDAGVLLPEFYDLDGTRNDVGFTGGPYAAVP